MVAPWRFAAAPQRALSPTLICTLEKSAPSPSSNALNLEWAAVLQIVAEERGIEVIKI
jgi:hypothetical protein